MTQAQRDAIVIAQAKFFAAQDCADVEDSNMVRANAAADAAKRDALYGAPARARQVIDDANAADAKAAAARDTQFEISSAAHQALNAAQLELQNAIRNSLQTGALERVA